MFSVSRPIEVVGVELLGDRDERHAVPLEHLDQPGEVHQRSPEAVHLVDHDHVDPARPRCRQQPLQRRALHGAAGDAAVVVLIADQHPALGRWLAMYGLAGLALGVERVELLLEPLLGGLPGVDRAAELADDWFGHAPPWFFSAEERPAVPAGAGDRPRHPRSSCSAAPPTRTRRAHRHEYAPHPATRGSAACRRPAGPPDGAFGSERPRTRARRPVPRALHRRRLQPAVDQP